MEKGQTITRGDALKMLWKYANDNDLKGTEKVKNKADPNKTRNVSNIQLTDDPKLQQLFNHWEKSTINLYEGKKSLQPFFITIQK
jgi:chromatin remodeling complex protein RSC6